MVFREEETLLTGVKNGNTPTIVSNGGNSEVEKAPFIAQPVRLTPAWEANNLPNDELNFRGMTMERATLEINPPRDRLNIIFFILLIHGIGTLMPWNMFITAESYFRDYKLGENYTHVKTWHADAYPQYVGFASQIPNVVLNWLNIFVNLGGDLTPRIVWSIIVEVIVFIATVGLAMYDTSAYPDAFFWITMGLVAILNTAGGIYQNSVYGMAAKLPFKYTGAVVLGSNISGAFASVVSILSLLFVNSKKTAAIYYFIAALFVLLACFDTYFALPLNRFYRYHELMHEKQEEKARKLRGSSNGRPPYWTVFKQAFPQLFNVFFIFFITLTLFPTVQLDIKRSNSDFFIQDQTMYNQVLVFLTFNICAMIGSTIASWVQWPSRKYLVWPVLLRVVFVPLFIFCNFLPKDRSLPIYIDNDWAYWGIAVVMALSSGYLSSLAMMYAPQTVAPQNAQTAGMFAAAMLITGIFCGISSQKLPAYIVKNVHW